MPGYRILSRSTLDDDCYNTAIASSSTWRNPTYGYTNYIDAVCGDAWSALVWGDYLAVAPIAINTKLLWPQVYMPLLCQQWGIYSEQLPDSSTTRDLLDHLDTYRRVAYHLPATMPAAGMQSRSNYILRVPSSMADYDSTRSRKTRKKMRLASELVVTSLSTDAAAHVDFCLACLEHKVKLSKADRLLAIGLAGVLVSQGAGYIIQGSIGGTIIASSLVGTEPTYHTLLMAATNAAGRASRAREVLIHQTIQRVIETGASYLDFEGSELPGVAQFFASHGADNRPYNRYIRDHMPWPIRILRPL